MGLVRDGLQSVQLLQLGPQRLWRVLLVVFAIVVTPLRVEEAAKVSRRNIRARAATEMTTDLGRLSSCARKKVLEVVPVFAQAQ